MTITSVDVAVDVLAVTPRMMISLLPGSSLRRLTPATKVAALPIEYSPASRIASPDSALTDSAVSCRLVFRFEAVTTISSMVAARSACGAGAAPAGLAPCSMAAATAAPSAPRRRCLTWSFILHSPIGAPPSEPGCIRATHAQAPASPFQLEWGLSERHPCPAIPICASETGNSSQRANLTCDAIDVQKRWGARSCHPRLRILEAFA